MSDWIRFDIPVKRNEKGVRKIVVVALNETEAVIRVLQLGYDIDHKDFDILEKLIHSVNNE